MYTQRSSWCAVALTSVAGSTVALGAANPQPTIVPTEVVHGAAQFASDGVNTTITASDGAIINYSQFDVLTGESVTFLQPGADARVLNRINSVDPSHINGALSANGIVYLVNPSGVIFGEGAVISAAGLVAAAANIADADFLAGVDRFTATGGVVSNLGVIQAEQLVHLVGSRVENSGTIVAPEGVVSMSAGENVYLATSGSRLMVRVEGGAGETGGVSHSGSVDAGEALFTTGDLYSVALGGSTTAETITAHGGAVALEGATVDASGAHGGGDVSLTGEVVFIDDASSVRADATITGAGGRIDIIGDDAAGVFGDLSARGATGKGGFIETSAGRVLRVTKAPDVSGSSGGEWLIDPTDLDIVLDGMGTMGVIATPDGFASSAVGAQIEVGTVVAGLLLGDVTLMTSAAGAEAGDITLLGTLDFDGVSGSTLTLEAHNNINLDRDILDTTFGDGDALNLVLTADLDGDGFGGVNQNRDLELGMGSLLATGAFYNSAPTSEIIGTAASIDVMGDAFVPGRVFLTGALDVRAMGEITFQPGAVIAGSVDSRSGLDGSGDTLFAPGALQFNVPVISFRAGIPTSGTARVRIADNVPILQGAAFNSRPSDFAIAQSAALTSADLPALSDFGNGALTTLSGMDYTIETLGAGRDIALNSNARLRGADLRVTAGGDLDIPANLIAGALIARANGAMNLGGNVTATGGNHRGTVVDADLSGASLATSGTLAADSVGLSFTNSAQLRTQGDALIVDPLSGNSGAGGDLSITALAGDIAQGAGATQALDADDATFVASDGSIALGDLNATGLVRLVSQGSATVVNSGALTFGGGTTRVDGDLDVTAGGDISDSSAVEVAGESRFDAAGAINLDQLDATGTVFLDSVLFASVTNAQALVLGDSNVGTDLIATTLAGGISDNGNVNVGGAASLETLATGDIALDTTTAPGGFSLITADGNASLAGTNVTLNNAMIAGDFVVDAAAFTLAGDAVASGSVDVTGDGTASGAGDQLVSAGTTLTLNDELIKTTSGDLTLVSSDLMTLGGNVGANDGSLLLNPAGRAIVPDRATIAGMPDGMGELRLSASDSVVFGRREKMTVLGSLVIDAGNEIVTGDLNAFGDLTLNASQLTLLSRDGSRILEQDGLALDLTPSPDAGVDLIAAGAIDINAGTVQMDFDSASDSPVILATDGESVSGAGGFQRRQFSDQLEMSDFVFAGVVLDLAAPPATTTGNPAGLEGDAAQTDGGFILERAPQLDPALAIRLAEIGVPVRSTTNDERVATVSGRGLYDDVSVQRDAASARLSGTVARSLVERYDALAGEDFARADDVRDRLGDLYAQFLAQATPEESTSGEAMARYMAQQGAADELDAIAAIDRMLGNLGLTGIELVEARQNALGRLAPENLSTDMLRGIAASAPARG